MLSHLTQPLHLVASVALSATHAAADKMLLTTVNEEAGLNGSVAFDPAISTSTAAAVAAATAAAAVAPPLPPPPAALMTSNTAVTGFKGVSPCNDRFKANCNKAPCKSKHLGTWDTAVQAAQAYLDHHTHTQHHNVPPKKRKRSSAPATAAATLPAVPPPGPSGFTICSSQVGNAVAAGTSVAPLLQPFTVPAKATNGGAPASEASLAAAAALMASVGPQWQSPIDGGHVSSPRSRAEAAASAPKACSGGTRHGLKKHAGTQSSKVQRKSRAKPGISEEERLRLQNEVLDVLL